MNLSDARLLFDECLGRPAVDGLSRLVAMGGGEKPTVSHLFEFAPPGTRDEVWLPKLAVEGWTVITADRGSTANKMRGEKLPRLCARHGVTHVLLSSSVHMRTSFEKLLTVMSVWYELLEIAADPARRGERYALEPVASLQRGRGRLSRRAIPPSHLPPSGGPPAAPSV